MAETVTQKQKINVFARTNFRHKEMPFGIKADDRRRHIYVMGKTGMGKTTMIENMVMQDIFAGNGVAFVDPHGDAVEKLLKHIPPERINDVVYFNPADMEYPIAFNPLESVDPQYKHLVASGLMGVFTKIWENVWSARMEYILNNTILALLDTPGNTMLGIARMHADKKFRNKIVGNIKDPVVKSFWVDEYANYNERFRSEAVAPIQNKVGQFLSSNIIRNIVGQPKSTLDLREIMDGKKIFLMNLSKGRIGEDSSALLGAMLITRLQLAAMSRVDQPEDERQDFYLYVDEFQNFATESFASILSEARKYRLNLIVAHQYIEQLDEAVRAATFGNVGTIVLFRVGAGDAKYLEPEFEPVFEMDDLVNLSKFHIILKLMINGVASRPFSAVTLPPISRETGNEGKVIRVSRERYGTKREDVEEKISRWMGHDYHKETAKQELTEEEEEQARYKAPEETRGEQEVSEQSKEDTPRRSRPPVTRQRKKQRPEKSEKKKEKKKDTGEQIWEKAMRDTEQKVEESSKQKLRQASKKLTFDFGPDEEGEDREEAGKGPASRSESEAGKTEKTEEQQPGGTKKLEPGQSVKF